MLQHRPVTGAADRAETGLTFELLKLALCTRQCRCPEQNWRAPSAPPVARSRQAASSSSSSSRVSRDGPGGCATGNYSFLLFAAASAKKIEKKRRGRRGGGEVQFQPSGKVENFFLIKKPLFLGAGRSQHGCSFPSGARRLPPAAAPGPLRPGRDSPMARRGRAPGTAWLGWAGLSSARLGSPRLGSGRSGAERGPAAGAGLRSATSLPPRFPAEQPGACSRPARPSGSRGCPGRAALAGMRCSGGHRPGELVRRAGEKERNSGVMSESAGACCRSPLRAAHAGWLGTFY